MRDLYKIADIVKDILQENEQARNSDKVLYYEVCKRLNVWALEERLGDFLLTFSDYNLPQFESVGRARRKIQAQHPELRPTKAVDVARYERTIDFEKFARGEIR